MFSLLDVDEGVLEDGCLSGAVLVVGPLLRVVAQGFVRVAQLVLRQL